MKKHEFKFVFWSFLIWRLSLFAILFFAIKYIPNQLNFLGGGTSNYLENPMFWALGNFDGQHYVNIAQNGYGVGEYTFFPLYPLLIRFLGNLVGGSIFSYYLVGQIISNISFFIALIGFYKLSRIDYSEKISRIAVILLLLFPTSFYFAAVYTESLFLALLSWCFYFFRQGKYVKASMFGILLSFLRPVGVFIFPAFLLEWYLNNRKSKKLLKDLPKVLGLIPLGLVSYMIYLKSKVGDYFAFFTSQVLVGEHRSKTVILIPQTVYRYIFKIFPNLNYSYFPGVFFTCLEFVIGISYFVFTLALFLLTRPSYALFSFFAYLMPTVLGSFSSMPRYVLILFPVYLVLAKYLSSRRFYLFVFLGISFILLVISFSLFARGYWIS